MSGLFIYFAILLLFALMHHKFTWQLSTFYILKIEYFTILCLLKKHNIFFWIY